MGDESRDDSPSFPTVHAHSVSLSHHKLGDVTLSGDLLIEFHAEHKLSNEQLLHRKFPVDDEAPAQGQLDNTCDQVSECSTAADRAAGNDWVSILMHSVADTALFARECGGLEVNSGSLPSCGRARDLFPLPPFFDLVLDEISWNPQAS